MPRSCRRPATVPADKIFFLQISDAYRMQPPLEDREDEKGMRPRARWSAAYRPFPFQGYLPCVDFAKAVLDTGFRGYFSYEVFDQGPDGKGRDYDMAEFAKEAMRTQERLLVELACGVSATACFGGRLEKAVGRKLGKEEAVVVVVCGGSNVSVEMLAEWRKEHEGVE